MNYSGALATAGNLAFLGHYDGRVSAYDARTPQEVWGFNMGTSINAPLIAFAVNGKCSTPASPEAGNLSCWSASRRSLSAMSHTTSIAD
jgi:glucose dehydrogenase